jgi:hypothetical protein
MQNYVIVPKISVHFVCKIATTKIIEIRKTTLKSHETTH